MNDFDLIDAVARKTGEEIREVRRHGFSLSEQGFSDLGENPECFLDLVDLPEAGTVDWDEVLCGFREPFLSSTLKARRKKRAKVSSTSDVPNRKKSLAGAA